MKQFLKYVLATIVGIACIGVFTMVLSFIVMGVIAASSDSKPTIKDGTVLRISLSAQTTIRLPNIWATMRPTTRALTT